MNVVLVRPVAETSPGCERLVVGAVVLMTSAFKSVHRVLCFEPIPIELVVPIEMVR